MERPLESAAQYLAQTGPAVSDLFRSLEKYDVIHKKIKWPVFISPHTLEGPSEAAFKKWQRKYRAANKRVSERVRKYLGYRISIGTLCGSILQIANMGISLYSRNKAVPPEFSSRIKPESKVARFCIGRRVRGVPIGLIIYAGRNQYSHVDEEKLNPINEFIFNLLAHGIKGAEAVKDPVFDLDNKNITIYSSNILSVLEWKNFEAYTTDMEILLNP